MDEEINFRALGFKTKTMYEFPNIVNIEVYRGDCPCSCVHCPIGITRPHERKARFGAKSIEMDIYRKVIEEITKHPHATVRIHSVGEPLLWKDLVESLKFTHDCGVKSWIFTSATTKDYRYRTFSASL